MAHNIRVDPGDFRTSEQEYEALENIVAIILEQMHGYRENNDRQLAINETALALCAAINTQGPIEVEPLKDKLYEQLLDFIAHT